MEIHSLRLFLPHYLSLKEEHGSRMSQNRVLRRMFGPEREEVAGGWRRLHNEELYNLTLYQILLG
jgi:hypothetical protein